MLFIISGPSGSGKTTLVHRIRESLGNINFSVSHTTRKRRTSEVEGMDYYFIPESTFMRMIEEDKFAEWADVHGNYYGTSRSEIEEKGSDGDCILDIDIQSAEQLKEKYKNALFIFIMPPLFKELKKRLEARGDESAVSIKRRLEIAREEIKHYHQFDYIVVNDELEEAVLELESIIRSQRCRFIARQDKVESILKSFIEE